MSDVPGQRVDSGDAQATAAAWFAHVRSGGATAADHRAIEYWCDSHPANRAAWNDMNRSWDMAGSLRSDPAIMAMREQAMAKPRAQPRFRFQHMAAAAAVALAVVGAGAIGVKQFRPSSAPDARIAIAEREFRTGIGQTATMKLADGSIVTLNTDSAVRVGDWGSKRQVQLLKGQAFFKVAKDAAHPFEVKAGGNAVTALGTAFDVRIDPGRMAVTLVEGRVRVDTPAPVDQQGKDASAIQSTLMTAGSQLVWNGRNISLDRIDTNAATSWLHGQLVFNARPLSDVVAEMNRFSSRKITLEDKRLAGVPVSGVFQTGQPDAFVRALEAYRLARVASEQGDNIALRTF